MTETAPVVWIAEETPEAALALSQWASARGVKLVAPAAPLSSRAYSESEVTLVEQALARAREAVAQLDAEVAERQLARAEQSLRTHPELPQAAWLMAEVQRGWAARFGRIDPKDDVRAKRALAFADALDGGRVAGVGEPESIKLVPIHVVFEPVADADVTWLLDARPIAAGKLDVPAGEHHLVAISANRVRFADWVTLADGMKLSMDVAGRSNCSKDDLAHAKDSSSASPSSSGVRCPVWVSATGAPKGVRAALCRGSTCEPQAYFGVRIPRWPPIDEPKRGKGIPKWLTWSLVGVSAAGAALGILAATGIFAPPEHRTVFMQPGGVRPE